MPRQDNRRIAHLLALLYDAVPQIFTALRMVFERIADDLLYGLVSTRGPYLDLIVNTSRA